MRFEERDLEAEDGTTLRVSAWHPDAPPRALVLVSHGQSEHMGRHAWLAEPLTAGGALVVGPDQCIQVPDLNHTFSAMPHRSRVDAVVDAYGNDAAATQIARIADLHFTGNAWAILREAHHVALTAELRHAWINAGVSLELATAETTAHLAFLRAYMDAARDERVETWKIMTGDGTGTGVATTWNMLVAAFATDDDAYWNIAFLPDSSSIVELTDGAAGSTRAPL